MQVSGANQQTAAAKAAASGGLIPAFIAIGKSEGIMGYWKGNVPQASLTGLRHHHAEVLMFMARALKVL